MNQSPNYSEDFIDLRQYSRIIWRWTWLLILCAALAGGAAFLVSRSMTPVYAASTTLLINEAPDAQTSDYTALLMSERLARTYAQMLTQRPVLSAVIADLELEMDVEDLQGAVEVQPVRDTQLIELTVENENPYTAAAIANTLVQVFRERNDVLVQSRFAESIASLEAQLNRLDSQIKESDAAIATLGSEITAEEGAALERLQTDLAQYQTSYSNLLQSYEELRVAEAGSVSNVVPVEPAEPDFAPVRPRTLMNTALAIVVGGMLGLGAVFLIEYLDDTVKSPEELARVTDIPVIGVITDVGKTGEGTPYVAEHPRSPATEAFRALRSNIEFSSVNQPIRTLLITSPGPDEGKSTIAANLAVVMAQSGKKVILIDADLRRPRMHRIMGIPNRIGLSDLFVREPFDLQGVLRPWRSENLLYMASGGLPPNPVELLGSARMKMIIEKVVSESSIVIIDSPPLGIVTDAAVIAAQVDAVLLVIEPKRTPLGAVVHVVDQLQRADAHIIGIVMNGVPVRDAGYYNGYYRGYYYYSSYGGDDEGELAPRRKRRRPFRIFSRSRGQESER
jgi:non-specific protein-tyrosine kinase